MRTITFRTNAGQKTGLGHLARCAHLARELIENGSLCLFVVDYIEEGIAPFLGGLNVCSLYDGVQDQLDPCLDAQLFHNITKPQNTDWVIVDDYRLGDKWEIAIREYGYTVGVIDDLLRHHQCDLLIDPRWRGDETQAQYDALVPPAARKLLGPGYVMLSESFKNTSPQKSPDTPFTIMLGLGGSGTLDQCGRIIDSLLAHKKHFDQEIHITPVIGPLSQNTEHFLDRYQSCKNVTPIVGEVELYPHMRQADFYIGAAGGILYQLLALSIPALTFPLSQNQKTNSRQLEDIGHFFHIDNWSEKDIENIPAFITTVMQHYQRIKQLHATPKVALDGFGTRRISNIILGTGRSVPRLTVSTAQPCAESEQLTQQHNIRAVTDKDINHYLTSRNLDANCQNMIRTEKISSLDHYAWWFNSKRESFLLTKDGSPCLYIWHEVRRSKQRNYLIGGWFVCGESAGFQDIMLALNWQLEYCEKNVPGVPWIAVIHRQNKYVKRMNEYFDFQDVDPSNPENPYGIAISEIFDEADADHFHFVSREPSLVNTIKD